MIRGIIIGAVLWALIVGGFLTIGFVNPLGSGFAQPDVPGFKTDTALNAFKGGAASFAQEVVIPNVDRKD